MKLIYQDHNNINLRLNLDVHITTTLLDKIINRIFNWNELFRYIYPNTFQHIGSHTKRILTYYIIQNL